VARKNRGFNGISFNKSFEHPLIKFGNKYEVENILEERYFYCKNTAPEQQNLFICKLFKIFFRQ
jgi:hypothetical protein